MSVRRNKELAKEYAPQDEPREPIVARGTDMSEQSSPYKRFSHATLLEGGEAKPGCEDENVSLYGYKSLKQHAIEGPPELKRAELGRIWGVKPAVIGRWAYEGQWTVLRDEYHAMRHEQVQLARVSDGRNADIRRAAFEEREFAYFEEAAEIVMSKMREKTEDFVTPCGLESGRKSSNSLKADVSSLVAISTHSRLNLGMATKSTPTVGTQNNLTQVNIIAETRPPEADTRAYVRESLRDVLPEGALDDDELDAAIQEGEVME